MARTQAAVTARRALRRAIARRESVKIARTGPSQPNVYGFPLAIGRTLVLLHALTDFDLDGFQVLPLRLVTDVRSGEYERFLERVLRDEGTLREVWPARGKPHRADLPLAGWPELFRALGPSEELVIVECEDREPDGEEQDFFIGPVIGVTDDAVGVHHFDATATWDPSPSAVPFDEITRVRFDERYIRVFARYVGEPPAS
jgi:hypothetical protein